METIKKEQWDIIEPKSTVSKMKISLDEFNSRLETAEEKVDEVEDKSIKICQSTERKKKITKKNSASVAPGTEIKLTYK